MNSALYVFSAAIILPALVKSSVMCCGIAMFLKKVSGRNK